MSWPAPRYVVLLVFLGLSGMAFGSFLTVVVDRVPRGESIVRAGSRCPHCGVPIAVYDNVPVVSWLRLGGRCRSCARPIPAGYVLLELGMGAVFVTTALRLGADAALPAFLGAIVVHAAVTLIERGGGAFPLPVLHPAWVVVAGGFVMAGAVTQQWSRLVRGLVAAAAVGAVLACCRRLSRRFTSADVELGTLTGLALGWAGVANLAAAAAVASLGLVGGSLTLPAGPSRRWAGLVTPAASLSAALAVGLLLVPSR